MKSNESQPLDHEEPVGASAGWRLVRYGGLAVVVVAILAICPLAQSIYRGWKQHEIVLSLERIDAVVELDVDDSRNAPTPDAPDWLVDMLGVEYFANVVSVQMPCYCWPDRYRFDYRNLRYFSQLKELHAGESNIADADLTYVAGLQHLRIIELHRTAVGDRGLAWLKNLKSVEELDLHATKATDAGLESLETWQRLTYLDLSGTQISDAGLRSLSSLHRLKHLRLSGTAITDAGLDDLRGLTELQSLDLRGTRATKAGLRRLKALSKLQTVELEEPFDFRRELE
jgi:Leucine-rich repeat (LRR) protein